MSKKKPHQTGTENPIDFPLDRGEYFFAGKEDVELRLGREELFQLMLLAHEADITLNQMVETILREYIRVQEQSYEPDDGSLSDKQIKQVRKASKVQK